MKTFFSKLTLLLISIVISTTLFAQNNCLDFDGTDDYVTIPAFDFNSSSGITIEMWVNATDITTNQNCNLMRQQPSGDPDFLIAFQVNGTVLSFGLKTSALSGYEELDVTISASDFENSWNHIAAVYNGTTMKIYQNGVEIGSMEKTGAPIYTGTATNQLSGYAGTNELFNGKIDEVRIWNNARTETEIRQNMYWELPDPSSETNLVSYYKLNETSGTTADNTEGTAAYDGTLHNMDNSDWQTSPAMFGPKNCLDFNGSDDYVSISGLEPDGLGSITIETWVYFDSFNGAADANISNVIRSGNENVCLRIGDGGMDNNMPQFVVAVSGQTKCNANARLETGKWYHIAGVYDGSQMELYINGKLDNTEALTGNIASTSEAFLLGGSTTDRMLDGKMDEVRIWSDARTATEIRENMCKNLTGNEDGLLAYYSFDNSSGTTLQDFSGNGYDGTLTNMDNSDWVASSAFNTWLNTSSSNWSTASNWSRGSIPPTAQPWDNLGIFSYSAGTDLNMNHSEMGANNLVVTSGASGTLNGYLGLTGNLILENDLDLNGNTIDLGENSLLIESAGRLYGSTGSIRALNRVLNNISSENVAGLGAEITCSANMGSTTITRTHAANPDPASIKESMKLHQQQIQD